MILKSGAPYSAHYGIHDCAGAKIPYVYSFDTETKEVEMLVRVNTGEPTAFLSEIDSLGVCVPCRVKVVVRGAYVTRDGREIEDVAADVASLGFSV